MADRRWCPDCQSVVWRFKSSDDPHRCTECDTRTVGLPWHVKVRIRVGQAIAYTLVAAFLAGPPVYIVYTVITNWGDPLIEFREVTITTTQVQGILPDVGGVFFVWLLILIVAFMMASGVMPRRI